MEQDPRFQKWLRPEQSRHVPLTHNFYEAFLRKNPGYNPNMETPGSSSSPNPCLNSEKKAQPKQPATSKSNVSSKLVEEIMESNKQLIEEAALQKAASQKAAGIKKQDNTKI
ncbi:hypothetical protein CAEBREN_30645 [Caenorhabditis brenneri]|uniref:Uncharacterized protein n=1 Tax=Caenorhabditis brenneri TaxID=135651 RepID=G0PIY1_CAEBE|nr:hypothetical protein CAEBREN_30645 [Caenorhabditis brenneri]